MYVHDLLLALVRRWYFLALGLAMTVGLCALAYTAVPLKYEATSSLLLLPPKSTVGEKGNPYLYLGGLSQALDVLSAKMQASDSRKELEKQFPKAVFEAKPDSGTSGPILLVTSTAPTAATAMSGMTRITNDVAPSLKALQDDLSVPARSRISVDVLYVDREPTVDSKTRLRAVLAIAGLGGAGTLLLTGFLDGVLLSRGTRRRRTKALALPDNWWADDADPSTPKSPHAVGPSQRKMRQLSRAPADRVSGWGDEPSEPEGPDGQQSPRPKSGSPNDESSRAARDA